MLNHKVCFAIIFLTNLFVNFSNNLYSKFHQTDYKIEFQRMELIEYDKAKMDFVEIKTFKYNRTLPAVNITFKSKLNLSNEVEVAVQFYKFLSNEYRKLSGSNFQVNMCKSFAANIAGIQICYRCGNFVSCQIVKGVTYKICNIYLDEYRFPSFLPTGEYRFQLDAMDKNDEVFSSMSMYLKIYRPVARPV